MRARHLCHTWRSLISLLRMGSVPLSQHQLRMGVVAARSVARGTAIAGISAGAAGSVIAVASVHVRVAGDLSCSWRRGDCPIREEEKRAEEAKSGEWRFYALWGDSACGLLSRLKHSAVRQFFSCYAFSVSDHARFVQIPFLSRESIKQRAGDGPP